MPKISFDPDMPKTVFILLSGNSSIDGKWKEKTKKTIFKEQGWVHEQTCHVLNPKGQEYLLSSPFMSATFIARLALFIEKWWIKMLYYDS